MRKRIKRRLFLMSMALAAGASGHAFAKGDKGGGEGHVFDGSAQHADTTRLAGDSVASGSTSLLHRVADALGGMRYGAPLEQTQPASKGWRLDLLPAQARPEPGNDLGAAKAKSFGVALRLAF